MISYETDEKLTKSKFVHVVDEFYYSKNPQKSYNMSNWFKLVGNTLINCRGGRKPYSIANDIILEEVYADEFEDLDWSKTWLNDSDSEYGWLDRDGNFYGCGYESHDLSSYFLFKCEVGELEEKGFVRVSYDYQCRKRLSVEQKNWLILHGYKIKEYDY